MNGPTDGTRRRMGRDDGRDNGRPGWLVGGQYSRPWTSSPAHRHGRLGNDVVSRRLLASLSASRLKLGARLERVAQTRVGRLSDDAAEELGNLHLQGTYSTVQYVLYVQSPPTGYVQYSTVQYVQTPPTGYVQGTYSTVQYSTYKLHLQGTYSTVQYVQSPPTGYVQYSTVQYILYSMYSTYNLHLQGTYSTPSRLQNSKLFHARIQGCFSEAE